MGPVLTMLTLRDYPFTLDVELGRETIFHDNLATIVLHSLVETSLVARIYVVHQSPKPKPQRRHKGKVRLNFNPTYNFGSSYDKLVMLKTVHPSNKKIESGHK